MPHLFDLHAESEQLAVLRSDPEGGQWLELLTLQGRTLGAIAPTFLPVSFHWSPDGSTLAFGSNDGLLYLFRPGDASPTVVFADPARQAGFCEWAADGKQLFFSAYDKGMGTPPHIYCLALDTGHTRQLTDDPRAVDRFPHGSPSGQWVAFQRQFLDEPDLPRRVYLTDVQSGDCFPALNESNLESEAGRLSWSPDSSSLLLRVSDKHRVEVRVIRLQDQSTTWRYHSETLQHGVFSPQGDQILCIGSDELLCFAYPEGTLLQRLALAAMSPVSFDYTGPQVAFDAHGTTVYFIGAKSNLYRWTIGGEWECILEERSPIRLRVHPRGVLGALFGRKADPCPTLHSSHTQVASHPIRPRRAGRSHQPR